MSAEQWLTITHYNDPELCVRNLRNLGFKIWATDLGPGAVSIDSIVPRKDGNYNGDKAQCVGPKRISSTHFGIDRLDKPKLTSKQIKHNNNGTTSNNTVTTSANDNSHLLNSNSNSHDNATNHNDNYFEVSRDDKIALVLGNERRGISSHLREQADILS